MTTLPPKTLRSKQRSKNVGPVSLVRTITPLNRVVLFVKAGGRCEFDGCNRYLLEHPVTLTEGNFAEVAHIVAFRVDGPRGQSARRPKEINAIPNLMLLCPQCHKLIDDSPDDYTVNTLRKYKDDHERHIFHVTGLRAESKTALLVFTANIGSQAVLVPFDQMLEAISPRYPVSRPGTIIDLSALEIADPGDFEAASRTIKSRMSRLYEAGGDPEHAKHLSVFALGPIPLLIYLGTLLSNKIPTDLYQRHRDDESWAWRTSGKPVKYLFRTIQKGTSSGRVALVLSLSGRIQRQRLPRHIDKTYFVYEITLKGTTPSPTFLKTRADLEAFRSAYQDGLASIMEEHSGLGSIDLFPAVPAPIAILCGRELLPKAHPELAIYDFDKTKVGFNFQLKVNHGNS